MIIRYLRKFFVFLFLVAIVCLTLTLFAYCIGITISPEFKFVRWGLSLIGVLALLYTRKISIS